MNFVIVEYEAGKAAKALGVEDMLVRLFEIPYFKVGYHQLTVAIATRKQIN